MKDNNTNKIEQALAMYVENVSPSKENLVAILSQIPEQKKIKKGRAIRSPYMWLEITEFVMLCSIMLVALPTLMKSINDPFYQIDKEVEIFEVGIQHQDAEDSLVNSSL
jgi:hypothetical protein